MINKTTKNKIKELFKTYRQLSKDKKNVLDEIALAEITEMVYNSNAIENSTLTFEDTEAILLRQQIRKDFNLREVFETKNLAAIMENLLNNQKQDLTVKLILYWHKTLLTNINDNAAGRFRSDKEWIRVGGHIGANPKFTNALMADLVQKYNTKDKIYFLDKIAYFHAEFEIIHPFIDGNGRIGRILINQQLLKLGYPPIIIRNKNKMKDYYPLFDHYRIKNKYEGFTQMLALLLIEALNKRITVLSSQKIISLSAWAKKNKANLINALNKAKRQTIPAFRLCQTWMISEDFK